MTETVMQTERHSTSSDAAHGVRQPEAESGHDYPMATPQAEAAGQFYAGLIGPATLSVAASRLAADKAADADTRQFANFELREALAVTAILADLNTPVPAVGSAGSALLETLTATGSGADFDRTYMAAELANHEFLRDLAESYLKSAGASADAAETQERHLAMLALTAFKEHVVLSKNIMRAIGA